MSSRKTLKQVLLDRGYTEERADKEIEACRQELHDRLDNGEMPFDICEEWWRLESDYLDDLMII